MTVIATGLQPGAGARCRPPLKVVQHVPAASGTGTDNLPILNQPACRCAPQAHDYSGLTTPSVWRNGRTAAAKVDALASNGMDEIEIPAFLRKQAD